MTPTNKGSEKVDMPRYVTVGGTAYMRADLTHDLWCAAKNVDCSCSLKERVSGHRSECQFPDLHAAIDKYEGKS